MKIFKEFEGKTAFVTGAASGMGQAAAICFGGLGCRVAVAARNPKALETVQTIRENGGEAIFVECDVTDDDSVRNAIETTVKTFGSLDYAFNNAGCGADGKNIPFAPLTEVAESDWQKECRQARAVRILKTLKNLKNRVTCFRCEPPGIHPNLPRRNMGTAYQNAMRKSLMKMCRIETERIATPVAHMLYLTYAETTPDLGYDSNGGQRL